MKTQWYPSSWIEKPCRQLSFYPFHSESVKNVIESLSTMPGIVSECSIRNFKKKLSNLNLISVNSFILQSGDCAESYANSSFEYVNRQIQLIDALSDKLKSSLNKSVIKILRLAGQFGKPRSKMHEQNGCTTVPSYHGDIINEHLMSRLGREPDPYNMLIAYAISKKKYRYMQSFDENISKEKNGINLKQSVHYTSHEAFLLPYEQALTRRSVQNDNEWINLSAHMLWLGYRSIYHQSPHVEYLRGVINPVGIKLGPNVEPNQLIELIQTLNPANEPGKIMLIYRLGVKQISSLLPNYIRCVEDAGLNVLWLSDPMHGNTEMIRGVKFRCVENIIDELIEAIDIHNKMNVNFAGIHMETSAEDVQECGFKVDKLKHSETNYHSLMDPRLNSEQANLLIDQFVKMALTSESSACIVE